MPDEDLCPHELLADECSLCRSRARRAQHAGTTPGETPPTPFKAHYPGICAGCSLDIYVGQLILRAGPNQFRHKGC